MNWLYLLYGWLVIVSLTNWLWMRRLGPKGSADLEFMIPARDEATNLGRVLPPLLASGGQVTVFDDESTDQTASIARRLGAQVIGPDEPLQAGWTGKNRACHELSKQASAEWVVFLDADVEPRGDFVNRLAGYLENCDPEVCAVTGFPRMAPGRGLEPLYLGWVPWSLLALNPFGVVTKTTRGHNGFTNGQVTAWRREHLQSLQPYESVRNEILEDVKIGRMLARKRLRVDVLNLSDSLAVRMYPTLKAAFAGMAKNSADIGGAAIGSLAFAVLLLLVAWGWLALGWPALALLILSKIFADRVVCYPVWTVPFIPLTASLAAVTIIYSLMLKASGKRTWKGRTYT